MAEAREFAAERRPVALVGALIALTKQKQTILLLVTGVGAYALTLPGAIVWPQALLGALSLWLSVSGCTVLNMVLDRDIDAKMARTATRPLPMGELSVRSAVIYGLALSLPGLALAWSLGATFGAVVTAGFAIDFVVYTAWLKRRTPLSILVGGVSGGMPALAGRALAHGHIDLVGILLAAGVLLWIPAHILTLAMRRSDENRAAGVPAWPSVYGPTATRRLIAGSSIVGACTLFAAGWLLRIPAAPLALLALLGLVLCALAIGGLLRPSDRHDWALFKAASIYMASSFGCLVVGAALVAG
ncbi:MAG: protoheme IX farnesyltransferase [Coriobacteriia bacterium]|nr:protoheme IX farnesyltransferase [Coriobacteriia bacterium]